MCIVHRVSHGPISEGVYWPILTEIDKRQRTDSLHAPKVEGGGGRRNESEGSMETHLSKSLTGAVHLAGNPSGFVVIIFPVHCTCLRVFAGIEPIIAKTLTHRNPAHRAPVVHLPRTQVRITMEETDLIQEVFQTFLAKNNAELVPSSEHAWGDSHIKRSGTPLRGQNLEFPGCLGW